jgi:hypothetical protein
VKEAALLGVPKRSRRDTPSLSAEATALKLAGVATLNPFIEVDQRFRVIE